MRKARAIIILVMAMVLTLGACGTAQESMPATQPSPPAGSESAIVGKWRHGLPEECPASMDPRAYEELKQLPESTTYYLEFFETGEMLYIDDEGWIVDGIYTFIGDNYLKITLNPNTWFLAFGGDEVYEVQISGNEMWLKGGVRLDAPCGEYHLYRVD